jgi:hypothetical protein
MGYRDSASSAGERAKGCKSSMKMGGFCILAIGVKNTNQGKRWGQGDLPRQGLITVACLVRL